MKYIGRILLLTLLLAGCTKTAREESVDPEDGLVPITFTARGGGMDISAKAGADLRNPDDFLSGGRAFGVYGTWTIDNGTSANVFTKQSVTGTWDSTDSHYDCTYSPLRYWQKTGRYNFRAVYPASASTTSASNAISLIANYSMSVEDYDLMVANSAERNILTGDTSPVPLNFRHALAAVRFVFQKGSRATVDYYIDSFELQYLLAVGSLVFTSTAQDAPLDNQWWVADNFRPSSLYAWNGKIQIPAAYADFPGSGTTWEEWHCVIPQSLRTSTGAEEVPMVRFSSSIKLDNTPTYTDPSFTSIPLPQTQTYTDEHGVEHVDETVVWKAGYKYTYYIQIQPGGATIDVHVTEWDSYKVSVEDLNF